MNKVSFLCTKLFQKRGHYSREDIIQGNTVSMVIQKKTTDAVKIAKNPCNAKLAKKYCNISKVWNLKLKQDKSKLYLEFYIKWFYHRECELNSDDYQNCAMKLNQGEVKEVWNQMMSLSC